MRKTPAKANTQPTHQTSEHITDVLWSAHRFHPDAVSARKEMLDVRYQRYQPDKNHQDHHIHTRIPQQDLLEQVQAFCEQIGFVKGYTWKSLNQQQQDHLIEELLYEPNYRRNLAHLNTPHAVGTGAYVVDQYLDYKNLNKPENGYGEYKGADKAVLDKLNSVMNNYHKAQAKVNQLYPHGAMNPHHRDISLTPEGLRDITTLKFLPLDAIKEVEAYAKERQIKAAKPEGTKVDITEATVSKAVKSAAKGKEEGRS